MEHTIKNKHGVIIEISKVHDRSNMFFAKVVEGPYQYGMNQQTQDCFYFEPSGGPRIDVGTSLREYGADLPDLTITRIVPGQQTVIIETLIVPALAK